MNIYIYMHNVRAQIVSGSKLMRFLLIRAGTKKRAAYLLRFCWAGGFFGVGLLLSANGQS